MPFPDADTVDALFVLEAQRAVKSAGELKMLKVASDGVIDSMSAVIAKQFQFCWWAPLIFTSAVTGLHVNKLLELATKIDESRETTITTGQLNRFLEKLKLQQPPAGLKGRRPKINYVTQTGAQFVHNIVSFPGLFKGYAMFNDVGFILGAIPFKFHENNIPRPGCKSMAYPAETKDIKASRRCNLL